MNFHPRSPHRTLDLPTIPVGLDVRVLDDEVVRDAVELVYVTELDDAVEAVDVLLVLRVDEELRVDELVAVVGASVVDVVDVVDVVSISANVVAPMVVVGIP